MSRTLNDDIVIERLKGRYKIITTIITTVGVLIGAITGFGVGKQDVNLDMYIEKEQYDELSLKYEELLHKYDNLLANEPDSYIAELEKKINELTEINKNLLNQPNSNLSKDSHLSDSEKTDRFAKLCKLDWLNLQLREDNFYEIKESLNDSIGNNYTNTILCGAKTYGDNIESNTIEVEYYLNGQYTKFSGTFVIPFDTRNSDDYYNIYFFNEDEQFYKSIDLTAGVLPVPFEVNVTNLDKIKIKIIRTQKKSGNSSIGIVNGKFIV